MKNLKNSIIVLVLAASLFSCSKNDEAIYPEPVEPIQVTTFAGSTLGDAVGTAVISKFNVPGSLAIDSQGNIFVADARNHKIKKITPAGIVTVFAGSSAGDVDATGSAAKFNNPGGIVIDIFGTLYVCDTYNNKIKKISPAGVVTTLAGSTQGDADGMGAAAKFYYPSSICIYGNGDLYVSDTYNHKVKKVNQAGSVSTLAGGATYGDVNGTGTAAKFSFPNGIVVNASGDLFVADYDNDKVKKITLAGVVTTFVGSTRGDENGTESAAKLADPFGLTIDNLGNMYLSDYGNHKIKKITPAGVVTTIAGSTQGYADGGASKAKFDNPLGLVVATNGTLYVGELNNHNIRKIAFN